MASGISASSMGAPVGFGGGLGHQGDLQSSAPAQLISALGGQGCGFEALGGCCGREQYSSSVRFGKDEAFAAAGQGLADFLA